MIEGILPALITPLHDDQTLNTAALERFLQHLYQADIQGLYVAGQTGEGLQLPLEARGRLTEVAVANSPSAKIVMVHVGAAVLRDAIRLAEHAARSGAAAVSSLAPAGPFSFAEVHDYYRQLASASPLPLYVYHFSAYSQAISTASQLFALLDLSKLAGLKFTDYDLFTLRALKDRGANVLYGRDEILSGGLLFGADGGIGTFYNLDPEWFVEVYQLARAGDWTGAQRIQLRIQKLIGICQNFPMLAAVKQILEWQGFSSGASLSPRLNLTPVHGNDLRDALQRAGFDSELRLCSPVAH